MTSPYVKAKVRAMRDDLETQLIILNEVIRSFRRQDPTRWSVPRVLSDTEREAYLIEEKIKAIDRILKDLSSPSADSKTKGPMDTQKRPKETS